jgi:hypothetical protein
MNFSIRNFIRTAPFSALKALLCAGNNAKLIASRRDAVLRLRNELNDKIRILESSAKSSVVRDPDQTAQSMPVSILSKTSPWNELNWKEPSIPGMITEEEGRYYNWLGSFYLGLGEAVELGPWLGKSTVSIVDGLLGSGNFLGKKLHVFDDFRWRAGFMNNYVSSNLKMGDDADFLPLFNTMTAGRADSIDARAVAIQPQSWNAALLALQWNKSLIEMVFVDCGKAFMENEAWFEVLSPYFIKDATLIVMQDWRAHRKVPRKPYTQIWHFTETRGSSFELIHETIGGDVGTFLWCGQTDIHQ